MLLSCEHSTFSDQMEILLLDTLLGLFKIFLDRARFSVYGIQNVRRLSF